MFILASGPAVAASATLDCETSLPLVVRRELRQIIPRYRPLLLGRLQKLVEEKIGEDHKEATPPTKKNVERAILAVVAKYHAKAAGKLSGRAKVAYVAGGIASGAILYGLDGLHEPYKGAAKLFFMGYAIEINRALASLGNDRIAAKVRKWAANGTTSLHPDIVEAFLRVAQDTARVMDPTHEAGAFKINDALKTIMAGLDKVDEWREAARTNPKRALALNNRAATMAAQMVRVYDEHYAYLQPQEAMLTPIVATFLAEDGLKFRGLIEKIIAADKDSRLKPEKVKAILDAWMPQTLAKTSEGPKPS